MAAARPLPSAQYLQLWRRVFDRDASAPPDSVRTEAELRTAVVESDTLNRRLFATGRDEDGFIAPEILEDPYLVSMDALSPAAAHG